MEEITKLVKELPLYLQQFAWELLIAIEYKNYVTVIMQTFVLIEWIARYYTAVNEYKKDQNPDSWKDEDKLERFEDILYWMNQDLKIHFIKWDDNSILSKLKSAYWISQDIYDKIKECFMKYRNKLLHWVIEWIATERYWDEKFQSSMIIITDNWVQRKSVDLRKDTPLWWYNENIFIDIQNELLEILEQLLKEIFWKTNK